MKCEQLTYILHVCNVYMCCFIICEMCVSLYGLWLCVYFCICKLPVSVYIMLRFQMLTYIKMHVKMKYNPLNLFFVMGYISVIQMIHVHGRAGDTHVSVSVYGVYLFLLFYPPINLHICLSPTNSKYEL